MKTNIFLIIFVLFLYVLVPYYFGIFTVLPDQVYAGPTKGIEDPAILGYQPCIITLITVMVTPNLTGVYQQG